MVIVKENYLSMEPEIRKELMSSPGAFKAWFVCVLEEKSAEELYGDVSLREEYGINRNTLSNRKELINKALDEYVFVSSPEHF